MAEPFHRLVSVRASGCWEWTGSRDRDGYGRVTIGGSKRRAHRVAYERVHGAIPAGMLVCHSCDNPPCCNPAHLWLGSMSDNIRDAVRKGRAFAGERTKHCPRGHEYTDDNTYRRKNSVRRSCRTCALQAAANYYHSKKAEVTAQEAAPANHG